MSIGKLGERPDIMKYGVYPVVSWTAVLYRQIRLSAGDHPSPSDVPQFPLTASLLECD